MSFVNPCVSTTKSSYITLVWVLVSHHPDEAITISPSSPLDSDLDDVFLNLQQKNPTTNLQHQKHTHKANKIINCHLMTMQIVQEE